MIAVKSIEGYDGSKTSLDQHFLIFLLTLVRFPRESSFELLLESRDLVAGIMGASILEKVLLFLWDKHSKYIHSPI